MVKSAALPMFLAAAIPLASLWPGLAQAQTTLNGNSLALRSSGSSSGSSWVLSDDGYVGTYLTMATSGDVTVTVNASGTEAGGIAPRMNLALGDSIASFEVAPGVAPYQHTFSLPAGTHFLRTDFGNDPGKTARQISLASVTVEGASVANSNSNVNALAAADSYIENYRKGGALLNVVGAAPGTMVHAQLKQHAFRFGTAVGGTTLSGVNSFLNNTNYSNFLLENFNTVTQGNAGKWAYNEATRDVVTMSAIDRLLDYAEQHSLDVRLHNMLWGDSQQPNWASTLLNSASSGNATAKADLRAEISERINYYVADRAQRYVELDVLNEHVHQPKYWNTYGVSGVADIFSETAAAVQAAGSNAKLYLNEYNVLQYGADSYGNWYREDVEEVGQAGGAVSGIGVQYYAVNAAGSNAHSAARIQQIFQNLSVTNLPITLSEFGVQTASGTTVQQAQVYLDETMRMVFGTPNATTFTMWGFWANDVWNQAPLAALMDSNWNPTGPGAVYQNLMNQWDTDVTLAVDESGQIDFRGFYGDYEVTIDGRVYNLTLSKGTNDYQLVVALPGDFNSDNEVDAEDLAIWQASAGLDAEADANGDGETDGADLLVWQRLLGLAITPSTPAATAATSGVPEPSAIAMGLSAVAIAAARITAKRRRTS